MSRIKVTIKEGVKFYHFKTEEKCVVCPSCKTIYVARKFCLACSKKLGKKIATRPETKVREGNITKDFKLFNCSCVFSSWWRWGQHWTENHPKSRCKHAKWAMKKIEVMKHD
ncbi:MAG: hypothetical protein GY861_17150 [bacterium]|nr:hypothetical protein [bacterium]